MGRRWPTTDDFGPSDPLVKSGTQMTTSNGRSEMTSVLWILVLAFILHHPSQASSFPPAPSQLGPSWCVDNGCAEQFRGLGGCVNLAAPLKIGELSKRFDLGATSLKGLCGTVGCCHCMKLLHNSTEAPIAGKSKPINGSKKPTAKKPSAKKPGAKRPIKPKSKKPKPMKPKPKKPKSKRPKSSKLEPKKPKSKKPKSKKLKSEKPNSRKPNTKKPKPKKPQLAKETKASQRNQS